MAHQHLELSLSDLDVVAGGVSTRVLNASIPHADTGLSMPGAIAPNAGAALGTAAGGTMGSNLLEVLHTPATTVPHPVTTAPRATAPAQAPAANPFAPMMNQLMGQLPSLIGKLAGGGGQAPGGAANAGRGAGNDDREAGDERDEMGDELGNGNEGDDLAGDGFDGFDGFDGGGFE